MPRSYGDSWGNFQLRCASSAYSLSSAQRIYDDSFTFAQHAAILARVIRVSRDPGSVERSASQVTTC